MILVGYQRSIRQICRSPYIETTLSLPFVGMIGIAADRCHYWYRECRSLICEMVRKYLHPRNRAKRSATIELTLRGQKGLLLPYPSFAARRYYVLFCSLKSFDGWLRCGEISELNSVAHAGDTRLVVRGRWLSTRAKSRQDILARAIGTFQPSALGASAGRGPGSRSSSRKASRPSGFDPSRDNVSLAGGTRLRVPPSFHSGVAITAPLRVPS